MRKPLSKQTSGRLRRRTAQASRRDGRHAPGARARIGRRRAPATGNVRVVVVTMPESVIERELDAVEHYLADEINNLLR